MINPVLAGLQYQVELYLPLKFKSKFQIWKQYMYLFELSLNKLFNNGPKNVVHVSTNVYFRGFVGDFDSVVKQYGFDGSSLGKTDVMN